MTFDELLQKVNAPKESGFFKPGLKTLTALFLAFTVFCSSYAAAKPKSDVEINSRSNYSTTTPDSEIRLSDAGVHESLDEQVDYLIITRPMFVDVLRNDLVKWKEESKHKVKITTIEEIQDKYSGRNLTEKIKEAIVDNHHKGVKYVLLVGDTQVDKIMIFEKNKKDAIKRFTDSYNLNDKWSVPTGYKLVEVEPGVGIDGKKYEYSIYFSAGMDIFYADLDNWDKNSDGINEESELNKKKIGLEVYVGRWPVRTTEELSKIIEKTKKIKPVKEMTMFVDGSRPCKALRPIDFELNNADNNCFPYSLFKSMRRDVQVALFHNTEELTEDELNLRKDEIQSNINFISYDNNTTREEIIQDYNSQKGVIFESAHGSHDLIMPRNGIYIHKENLSFKNIFPLFDLVSCGVGTFFEGPTDSFSEYVLKLEKGPAIVVGSENRMPFYAALLDSKSAGEAYYSSFRMKWIQNDGFNVFLGDPSLKVFSEK